MARAVINKMIKTARKTIEAPAQKRRPGRPIGSKNRVAAAGNPASRPVVSPKMSKPELEAHVVKLERTITRLRERNRSLRLTSAERPRIVEAAAKPAKTTVRTTKAVRKSRPAAAAPVKSQRRSSRLPAQDNSPVVA